MSQTLWTTSLIPLTICQLSSHHGSKEKLESAEQASDLRLSTLQALTLAHRVPPPPRTGETSEKDVVTVFEELGHKIISGYK